MFALQTSIISYLEGRGIKPNLLVRRSEREGGLKKFIQITTMAKIKAYAAHEAKGELVPFEFELEALKSDEVEIDVKFCGLCHSDLSMLDNDWRISSYPFVPGHEIVGTISAKGSNVKNLQIGQKVGLGWFSRSCLECEQCMTGNHNLCKRKETTIVNRYGGFAEKVRSQATWAIPLPDELDLKSAGPLFCGGVTVFNPIMEYGVSPTDHVGVVGIGGLGHMAIAFLKAWGCEVTAFSTTPDKEKEARLLGAHNFVSTHDEEGLSKIRGRLDFIIDTVNVELNWGAYIATLKPKGRLHIVGAAPSVKASVFQLMGGQNSISSSPLGSPATTKEMLKFASRHNIKPMIEEFKIADVNKAIEHLRKGKPRYRIVLEM